MGVGVCSNKVEFFPHTLPVHQLSLLQFLECACASPTSLHHLTHHGGVRTVALDLSFLLSSTSPSIASWFVVPGAVRGSLSRRPFELEQPRARAGWRVGGWLI